MMNAWGNLLTDRLQDIPNHVREIAGHGVRQGAATALAVVQTQLGHKLRTLQPAFPEGEDRANFEELVHELDEVAGAVGAEVNVKMVSIRSSSTCRSCPTDVQIFCLGTSMYSCSFFCYSIGILKYQTISDVMFFALRVTHLVSAMSDLHQRLHRSIFIPYCAKGGIPYIGCNISFLSVHQYAGIVFLHILVIQRSDKSFSLESFQNVCVSRNTLIYSIRTFPCRRPLAIFLIFGSYGQDQFPNQFPLRERLYLNFLIVPSSYSRFSLLHSPKP